MTVFSEKVQPTFTSSDLNVIVVENFNEIFFDVFELEINGNKFVAEKVSEKGGKPVVSIPVEIDGKQLNSQFVLERGDKFEVFFNGKLKGKRTLFNTPDRVDVSTLVEAAIERSAPIVEVPDFQQIADNIKSIKESAAAHLERVQRNLIEQRKREIDQYESSKRKEIRDIGENIKKDLVSEFYQIVEDITNQLSKYNLAERDEYSDYISKIFSEHADIIESKITNNYELSIKEFDRKISELTDSIFRRELTNLIESKISDIENIIIANQNLSFKRVDSAVEEIEASNRETNNTLNKNINKALSRIGNIKNTLSEKIILDISSIEKDLRKQVRDQRESIESFFNEKINTIEEKFTDLSEEYKADVISLIRESESKILNEIQSVDRALPTLILKETRGKNKDNVKVSLEDIRKELETNISGKFSKEIISLKRLIEMTSGGGGGGAPQTLSFDEESATLTISNGNTVTLSSSIQIGEIDPFFTTWAQSNSSNYDLAYDTIANGGTINGNLSCFGDISAANIYSNNINIIQNNIDAIFSYLIQNFEHTYISYSSTINDFVSNEWSESLNLSPGDIILLSASNIAYILGELDGSGISNYYPVNLKPNFIFFKANLPDYSVIDTFPLSSMKSSKYILQVEDITSSDIFYCEMNVISNGIIATATEYGSNYTTSEPFVEFGAETDGLVVRLSAIGVGQSMSNFIFKGNRINVF